MPVRTRVASPRIARAARKIDISALQVDPAQLTKAQLVEQIGKLVAGEIQHIYPNEEIGPALKQLPKNQLRLSWG